MHSSANRNLFLVGALALALLLPTACRKKDDASDAAATATPAAAAITPTLQVLAPRVEFRETESDALEELPEGSTHAVAPGANVLVGESGYALLSWEGFLTNHLLTGADALLSLSLPQDRRAIIDQAAGTARYVLEGAGEPASIEIIASWIALLIDEGEADVLVSFIPGAEPSAWVVVLEGAAQVTRGEDSIRLESGEVAAFTEDGEMPTPQAADPSRIRAWFDQVARGTATGSIASVGLRCEVGDAGATLRDAPSADAEAVGEPLTIGTLVEILGRDEDGAWLRVRSLLGSDEGWAAASDLRCNGPAASAPLADELATGDPTATVAPLPTRALVAPVAPLAVTPTPLLSPTPTATLAADAQISFSADKKEIKAGECTNLRWEVSNIRAVYLNGEGVVGSGSKKVCPTASTTYVLRVELLSGGTTERSVDIKVTSAAPTRTPVPVPTNTPPPPTPTSVPPTVPPTLAPTVAPTVAPTLAPTAVPPTNTPDPGPTSTPDPSATP